jgi:hypothetical protein
MRGKFNAAEAAWRYETCGARQRLRGRKSRKAVPADILAGLFKACAADRLVDLRDRALLITAFACGGRRRSEIASLGIDAKTFRQRRHRAAGRSGRCWPRKIGSNAPGSPMAPSASTIGQSWKTNPDAAGRIAEVGPRPGDVFRGGLRSGYPIETVRHGILLARSHAAVATPLGAAGVELLQRCRTQAQAGCENNRLSCRSIRHIAGCRLGSRTIGFEAAAFAARRAQRPCQKASGPKVARPSLRTGLASSAEVDERYVQKRRRDRLKCQPPMQHFAAVMTNTSNILEDKQGEF